VVVIGVDSGGAATPLARAMFDLSLPGAILQSVDIGYSPASPALAGKSAIDGKPTAYACIGSQCSLPVVDAEALRSLLSEQRSLPGP
jgi:uncharacterized protein YyaL (SSP411 family)